MTLFYKKFFNYKDDFQGVGKEFNSGDFFEEKDWFSDQFAALMKAKSQGKQEIPNKNSKKNQNIIKFTGFEEDSEKEDCNFFFAKIPWI